MTMQRCLIVEDDRSIRHILNYILEHECSIKCHAVADLGTALRFVEKFKYSFVVLDYYLGEGTAAPLIPKLKDTPIILVTASSQAELIAEQNHISLLVKKPFDIEQLKQAIDSIPDSHKKKEIQKIV